ncbi:hypothetical protein Tco_0172976 [Tanacetum coccineum]
MFHLINQKLSATTITEGHFARECRSGRNQGRRSYGDNGRSNAPTNVSFSQATVVSRCVYGKESSKNLDELLNSQMSARDKTSLGYGTQWNEMSNNPKTDSEISLSVFYVKSSDEESTPVNDMISKADGYHVVPPPITGNFLTLRADISFAGLDEFAIRKKIIESKTTDLNTKTSEIIDDEDDVSEVQTVSPVKTNESQTVKPKIDCQEPKLKNVVNTGPKLKKPVWDNAKRQNEKRAVYKVSTARPASTARLVSTARPVSTVRPFAPKIAQIGAIRLWLKYDYYWEQEQDSSSSCSSRVEYVDQRDFKVCNAWVPKEILNSSYCFVPVIQRSFLHEIRCQVVDSVAPSHMTGNKSLSSGLCIVVLRAPRKDDCAQLGLKDIVPLKGKQHTDFCKAKLEESSETLEFTSYGLFGPVCIEESINKKRKYDEGYLLGYSTTSKAFRVYNKRNKRVEENLHINFLEDQPNVIGTGTQDSYVAGSSGKDKGPTQEYILLPLQPYRTRILVKDVAPAAHEQPFESSSKDNDVQDSEDVVDKEEQHQMKESEQDLQDELEKMVTQELDAKAMDDVSRQAFEEEKRRIASQKKAAQATSTNKLSTDRQSVSTDRTSISTDKLFVSTDRPSVSTDRPSVSTDRPFVSTDRTYVSIASTPIGTNAGESSFIYLGGKISIDASTLPNDDLPIDPNMPDMEDASDTLLNDGIFNGAYDDEDVGAVADFNNMDNTIAVSTTPTDRIHKDHPKGQILGDPTSTVQTRGRFNSFFSTNRLGIVTILQTEQNTLQGSSSKLGKLLQFKLQKVWVLVDLPYGKKHKGLDRRKVIDYDEVFAPVARIEAIRTATTPIESNKPLVKDEDGVDVDVHVYRSMIGSLMYLTASRPDIMFAVCACARFQVTPKASHLNAVKRIFRYLKHQPKLGLWYPRDSPFELEAFSDSDYGGASLDRKSTTGGCQFLGRRLISWQCKKQTIVANSTTEAEYVAAANCCGQVLWIQNQMMDYGFNFMNTKIHIDNESTISVIKNPVAHSRTKHIEIRFHFIRDCYEKRLIEVIKIHTDSNVADLLTKGFDVTRFNFLVVSIGLLNL